MILRIPLSRAVSIAAPSIECRDAEWCYGDCPLLMEQVAEAT